MRSIAANRCTVLITMERDIGGTIEVEVTKASSSKPLTTCLGDAAKEAIAQAHAAAAVTPDGGS